MADQAAPANPLKDPHPARGALIVGILVAALYLAYSLWWPAVVDHVQAWSIGGDTWMATTAAIYVSHGAYQEVYWGSPGYFALPLSAIILAPVVRLGQAVGLVNGYPFLLPKPTMWWVVGPWTLLWGAMPVLYAARAVAWAAGARRHLLALQVATALIVVVPCAAWGHFEDSLAVAGVLLAVRAKLQDRYLLAAILLGLAICSKQWAVIAVPFLLFTAPRGSRLRLTAIAAVLPILLVAEPLALHPHVTLRALLLQPTPPLAGHHIGHGSLLAALGPAGDRVARIVTVLLAGGVACWVAVRRPRWLYPTLTLGLLLRPLLEPFLFGYYLCPGIELAVVAMIIHRRRVDAWLALLCACPVIWAMPNARGSNLTWWAGELILLGVCAFGFWRLAREERIAAQAAAPSVAMPELPAAQALEPQAS